MPDPHEPQGSDPDARRVEAVLREITDADIELVEPPPDLWDRIDDEIRGDQPEGVVVVPLARRLPTPSRFAVIGVAAASLVLVAAIATALLLDDAGPTVVARADLDHEPAAFDPLGAGAAARAELVDDDGTLRIDLEETSLPQPLGEPADLELWLIEPDEEGNPARLVSLGVVDPDQPSEFAVPPGFDPDVYFVVDISVEPRDGDAAHSGRSILRGALTPV